MTDRDDRPRVSGELAVLSQDGEHLLVDPAVPAWAVVNESGKRVAALLDGTRTIAQVALEIAATYSIPYDIAASDVSQFVDRLTQAGVCWTGERLLPKASPVAVPVSAVYVEVTDACNLRCRHCFASPGGASARCSEGTLDCDDMSRLLREARELSDDVRVALSGGEPLLRDDINTFLSEADGLGLGVDLLTNGTLVTRRVAGLIANSTACVSVSIDGATARTHDATRGHGAFERTMSGLRELVDAGVGPRTSLSVTPMRDNISEIPALFEMASELGVKGVHFSHLARQGAARDQWPELGLSADELADALLVIESGARTAAGRILVSGDYCGQLAEGVRRLPPGPSAGCPLGRQLAVRHDGVVFPCVKLRGIAQFAIGNVRLNSLSEIATGSLLEAARRTAARRLAEITECTACEWRYLCRAGCPAQAIHAERGPMGKDPFCEVNRKLLNRAVFEQAMEDRSEECVPV